MTSLFHCRDCGCDLTRANTGGYCAGRPDVCKDCEERAYRRAYTAFAPPPCAGECVPVLRGEWARACKQAGVPVAEAHITHVPPLIPSPYEDLQMRCPHGVLWHMQPTSEQIVEWVRDGVE